ncbi:MAG: LamG-like jellyroll fold domain-containing protein [Candidatus Bathyarchaeia archaeon]
MIVGEGEMTKRRYWFNSPEQFLGVVMVAVILSSFFLSSSSLFIEVASAAPTTVTLAPKWTKSGLGDGLWEGGVVIGDVVKSTPGEEVVFATDYNGGTVYCLNGQTGATIWTYRDSSIYAYAQTTLYDLDGDGNLEVCVPLYYVPGLLVLRSNGALWWRTTIANAGTTMGSFAAADVNHDGKLEIFHGSQNVEAGADGKFVGRITKLSYDGKILAQTFNWRACSGGVSIADADHDGVFEIYTGDRDMYMNDGNYGRGVRSFWADNLTERWCMPDVLSSSQCPVLADVNGDGVLDVIVSDMSGGVLVLNSTSGSAKPLPFRKTGSIGVPGHYQTTVCDIDGDGHLEMIAADGTHSNSRIANYSDKFVIYDLVTGVIEKELVVGQCKFSPTVADLNGDGKLDIIACNMTAIIVFTYDNGNYVKIGERGNLLSGLMYAMVQDIDNDGLLEVVVSRGSGSSAVVYAFDTTAPKPAQRARSEIKWYSEYRRGVAEYVAPPGASSKMSSAVQSDSSVQGLSVSSSEKTAAESMITAQDVLDSFGKTDQGGSTSNLAQYWYGSRYQISEDGTASSISLYVSERNGENRPLKVAIYQDSSGVPTTLLAQGVSTIPASFTGWFTVSLSSYPDLSANNYYWLVANAIASSKTVRFYYSSGATNQGVYGTTTYASFPTNPCVYSNRNNRAYSIYCNYEPISNGGQGGVLTRLANGDLECNATNAGNSQVFNWYVNDYKNPTTSTPESLTRLLLTFDNNDPNAVQDYSSYGNNGLVHGATWTSEHGGAYVFDGQFDYIMIPDGGSGYFNGYPQPRTGDLMSDGNKSEMSLEMWVYLPQNQTDVRFVSKIPSYEIGIGTDGRLFAGVFRQRGNDDTELGYLGYTSVKTSTALNLNSWQHVALTYKDGVGLKLFLNGVMVASANAQGNIHCSSGVALMIGWFDYFKGMIDDVRLYSQCLSDQQINQHYLEQSWTNRSIIKSEATRGQEKWKCMVIENGKSTWALTAGGLDYIEIPNNAPTADDLAVGPRKTLQPIDTDDLTATYAYHDVDENVELGSEIRWYDTGVLQSDLNNKLTVPASRTSVGDKWYLTVRPRDGKDFGATATSPTVTIVQNNRPTIQGTPNLQKQSGNLVITPTTSDTDGPTPTRKIYNWRVGGTSISNLQMPFDTDNIVSGAKDYSPSANNGVVSDATWTSSGAVGGAYHFDGNDMITCADNNLGGDAAGTWTQLTIEFWIKVDGWLNRTRIVAKKVGTSSSGSYMVGFQSTPDTNISNGNQLFFSVTTDIGSADSWSDANPSTHVNNFLIPGNWYYIVCTYKSGPGLTVYINGTQTVNVPWNGTITTETEFVPGDEPLFIGSDGSGDARRYLVGTLDELVIYNRALSSQQVTQGFQESKNGQSTASTIVAQETSSGQTWTCMVTANDRYGDGTPILSNSVGT